MTTAARPRRSVLYMPGSNARALEKGREIGADALILDLEDAVAPDAKETGRRQIAEASSIIQAYDAVISAVRSDFRERFRSSTRVEVNVL
mgnify:CR=1 FL=1